MLQALPSLIALLNAVSAICLALGYWAILRKQRALHRLLMIAAFVLSVLFLLTYIVHHSLVGAVRFEGAGLSRLLYFLVLVPHVVLAFAVVPLSLMTIYRATTARFTLHRQIARYTLPIWLYVSVSGIVVYFMLYRV